MIPIILVSTEICPHVIGLTVIEFCADGNCFHWFSFLLCYPLFFSVNTTSRLKCFGWVCCMDCCEILDKHLALRALVIFAIKVLLDRNIFFLHQIPFELVVFCQSCTGKTFSTDISKRPAFTLLQPKGTKQLWNSAYSIHIFTQSWTFQDITNGCENVNIQCTEIGPLTAFSLPAVMSDYYIRKAQVIV